MQSILMSASVPYPAMLTSPSVWMLIVSIRIPWDTVKLSGVTGSASSVFFAVSLNMNFFRICHPFLDIKPHARALKFVFA